MKKIIIIFSVFFLLVPIVWAKRIPAPKVEPVTHNGIQYVAPNDDGRREYIRAFDVETGKLLKEITLKKNFISPWIQEDVQWFYITKMEVKEGHLVLTDEKNRVFKVKLLKKIKEK